MVENIKKINTGTYFKGHFMEKLKISPTKALAFVTYSTLIFDQVESESLKTSAKNKKEIDDQKIETDAVEITFDLFSCLL